ncbi:MAG: hypothetical protein ACREUZ_09565 [Burkholderiales bacterium]
MAFEVRILLNGREADRVLLREDQGWRNVRLIPVPSTDSAFIRIDLEVWTEGASEPMDALPSDSGGMLKVGRPFVNE